MALSSYKDLLNFKIDRNFLNFVLALVVPLPAIIFQKLFLQESGNLLNSYEMEKGNFSFNSSSSTDTLFFEWDPDVGNGNLFWKNFVKWGIANPVGLVALIFFFNVNILFWGISLVQKCTWLIDPYWSLLPPLMALFYASHPTAVGPTLRCSVVSVLVVMWSVRLTHSYFRREGGQWGAREDWRFADLRNQYRANGWWWRSFFFVYISQEVFLVGICLPFYAVFSSNLPWNLVDLVATIICISALIIAYYADTQLHHFVTENNQRKKEGKAPNLLLDTGLWRYSRHPNYFGEQLWWWGLALYACGIGKGWTMWGTFVNSMCMVYVTVLVERRMLEDKKRTSVYENYRKTTSVWIPWFPKTNAS